MNRKQVFGFTAVIAEFFAELPARIERVSL
jgi:hypothetical protein